MVGRVPLHDHSSERRSLEHLIVLVSLLARRDIMVDLRGSHGFNRKPLLPRHQISQFRFRFDAVAGSQSLACTTTVTRLRAVASSLVPRTPTRCWLALSFSTSLAKHHLYPLSDTPSNARGRIIHGGRHPYCIVRYKS